MSDIVLIERAARRFQRGVEEVRAIDGVDLNVSRGEYLAIVGRSGSGKTTLLNLMGCIDRPTSGCVTVHGMVTGELSERALATIRSTTIGFVFQHFFLIPTLTAVENVMLPGRFSARRNGDLAARARGLLDMVGLAERADHLPHELSGGEMQRVALARALINEPEMLLADEPTGNLDTKSAREIAELFAELNEAGLTIVVVTHSSELTGDATRILHLQDGKIVEDQRLRPVPAPARVAEGLPAPAVVPEYMPSSLRRRRWGSPAAAAVMVLLGALMLATAFLPFIGRFSGYGLLERGTFTVRFFKSGGLTRILADEPAVLFTGFWPILLGSLLALAGILFLFNLQRIGRWSALVIGAGAATIAVVDILMIQNRLGPGVPVEYGLWVLFAAGIASLALGLLLVLIRMLRPAARSRED
jgi:putative ABC transport system ATP-binding protein